MNDDIRDDALDDELDISRLYDRSKDTREPSKPTTDAILAAARRELQTGPSVTKAPRNPRRWMVPASAAAVILLSTTLYLDNQTQLTQSPLPAGDAGYAPATPAARLQKADDAVRMRVEPEPQSPATGAAALQKAESARMSAPAMTAGSVAPSESKAQRQTERLSEFQEQAETRSEPKAAVTPSVAPTEQHDTYQRRDTLTPADAATMGAAEPAATESTATADLPSQPLKKSPSSESASNAPEALTDQAPATARSLLSAPHPAPSSLDTDSVAAQPAFRAEPTQWLTEIVRLLDNRQWGAALDEWGAFKVRFPSHPVPDELLARLQAASTR